MNNFKIDLSDTTLYVWKIQPGTKFSFGKILLGLVFFLFFPLILFSLLYLIGLLLPGLAKGIAIFFSICCMLLMIAFIFIPFIRKDFENSASPYFREIGSVYKGIFEFMKASVFTLGTSVSLYFILIDYYSIGKGFSIEMGTFWDVVLYYFENILGILCFDIPNKLGFKIIDAEPITKLASITSVFINLLIGAGAIQFIYMFLKLRWVNEFTGTISDCYHECNKYIEYIGLTSGKKDEYIVELEGIVNEPNLPIIFDINDFCNEAKKTSIF